MPITALYAVLLTMLFVVLSVRVTPCVAVQAQHLGMATIQICYAESRSGEFRRVCSFGLDLLGLAEGLHTPIWLLHLLGLALLIGRLLHAYGVSRTNEQFVFRVTGVAFTLTMLISAAITCFTMALLHKF